MKKFRRKIGYRFWLSNQGSITFTESLGLKSVSLLLALILWITILGFKREELKKNVKSAKKIAEKVKDAVINELCANNSEFNNEYTSHPRRATPKIILHKYESPKYFSRQGKQKWVDK